MDCNENKCVCQSMCGLIGSCIIDHELFTGYKQSVTFQILMVAPGDREKRIIDLLQQFKPPKVSGSQIARFYAMRRHGINLDSKKVGKKLLKDQLKFDQKKTRKKRKMLLKSDESRNSKKENKKKRSLVGDYLQRHGIDGRSLPKEEKQKVYSEAAEAVTKMLAEPDPNFHSE